MKNKYSYILAVLVLSMALFTGCMLVDEIGSEYGVREIDNKPRVSSTPYLYDIAGEKVPYSAEFRGLGYNSDVDNAVEDLWAVGGAYVFPAAGQQLELVSTSDEDSGAGGVNPAGTGIRTVLIRYLDDTWAEQQEAVTLDGTTVVTTTANDIYRIQSFYAITVGTTGYAVGNIDIRNLADTPIYARISTAENKMLQAIWTVPIDTTALLVDWRYGSASIAGGHSTRFVLQTTSDGNVFNDGVFHSKAIGLVTDGTIVAEFALPLFLPARTDVKISVRSDDAAANCLTAGQFQGYYEYD